MNYVLALIDRAKEFVPKKTDYGLCKEIDLRQTDLAKIKKGRGFFGPKQRARLAEITKIPHEDVTAMLEFERAKTDEDKEFWKKRLPRISAAMLIGIAWIAATHGNMESTLAFFLPVMPANSLYIMRSDFFVGTFVAVASFLFFCANCKILLRVFTTSRGCTARMSDDIRPALTLRYA